MSRLFPILLLGFLLPRTGLAEDPDPLIDRGVELRREGRDAEALELFRAAYEASRSPRALAQVALAHQALGNWIEAEAGLSQALQRGGAWIERNRRPLEGALVTVRARLGWLEVRGTPEGAQVEANGRPVGVLPLDGPVRVVAGDVVVRVSAAGYAPISRTVAVRSGRRARETFRLVRIGDPEDTDAVGPGGLSPGEPERSRASARPRGRAGSVAFGVPHAPTLLTEVGYSALPRATYLAPLGRRVALGVGLGLDLGLFGSLGEDVPGTLTMGAAVPLHIALADGERVRARLALRPGLGLTIIDYTNVLGASGQDLPFDVTGEYFAVLLHSSFDVGYRWGRVVTLGGGVEVPVTLFYGGGTELADLGFSLIGAEFPEPNEFAVVPVLIGPSLEIRISESVTLGAKVRLGPHLTTGEYARDVRGEDTLVELGLQAQLGLAIAL